MSAEQEAAASQIIITDAVRQELHYAVEQLCDTLLEQGKLGAVLQFTLTPAGNEQGKGDEVAVTLSLQMCPLYDGKPVGRFVLADYIVDGETVH